MMLIFVCLYQFSATKGSNSFSCANLSKNFLLIRGSCHTAGECKLQVYKIIKTDILFPHSREGSMPMFGNRSINACDNELLW